MITIKDGLLYRDGVILEIGEADRLAYAHRHPDSTAHYMCCEQVVRELEKNPNALLLDTIAQMREALKESRDAFAWLFANGSTARCNDAMKMAIEALKLES
jgi:hypothetical protein